MAHWLLAGGALPVMIPSPFGDNAGADEGALFDTQLDAYAQWLDGLVLHGGADLSPTSYGETALKEAWKGDRARDDYERALAMAFVRAGKPVFGVCRGLQLINVAFGGTLYQDINTQKANTLVHRDATIYDANFHMLQVLPHTRLAQLVGAEKSFKINSIHHQGIKDLAPGFVVEARCPDDGVVEAIRGPGPGYVAAVQWHPEFHRKADGTLNDGPILQDFLQAALQSRLQHTV